MKRKSVLHYSDGLGRPWVILIIVLSVLVVGGLGYVIGKNQAESDAKAKYDKQVQQLNQELDKAKNTVSSGAQQGQQTVDSLKTENAQLKSKVQEQEKKISDLEDQLEQANNSDDSTTPTQ